MAGKKMPESKLWRNHVSVCLDDETYEKICDLAAKNRRTMSSQIRFLLKCFLK